MLQSSITTLVHMSLLVLSTHRYEGSSSTFFTGGVGPKFTVQSSGIFVDWIEELNTKSDGSHIEPRSERVSFAFNSRCLPLIIEKTPLSLPAPMFQAEYHCHP